MGKEKELLKAILANTEKIMDHLGISQPAKIAATKLPAKKIARQPAKKTIKK